LIAAKTTDGRSLFAPAFLCEHSRNEYPDLQVYNDGVEVGKPKPGSGFGTLLFPSPIKQRGAKRRDVIAPTVRSG